MSQPPSAIEHVADGNVKVLTGSALSPDLPSFLAQHPERNTRFDEAVAKHPEAVMRVVRHQAEHIQAAAQQEKRSFTIGRVDENDDILSASTHMEAEMPQVLDGILCKDKAFVNYVKTYHVGTQQPVYVAYEGGFLAGVVGAKPVPNTQKDVLEQLRRIIDDGPAAASAAAADAQKKQCMNATCGAMDKPMRKCSRCKAVWYCSPQCQAADWRAHKQHCSASTV
jgi:hypothetical protein